MHMSDALISPLVGGTMWVVTAATIARAVRKSNQDAQLDGRQVPLMGVMGAFVFAAQMINFSIPGTGSSGHLAGGLLLAAMLGAPAGFLTLAVVITVQALFFADGGLLALGCNIFNMGFFSCFLAYPLILKPLVRNNLSPARLTWAAVLAAVVSLQLGAFSVVLETVWSGRAELPLGTFALLMQPVHLAIGVGEGLITAALLLFLRKAAPTTISDLQNQQGPPRSALALLGLLTLLCAGLLCWFASSRPDGLEWSLSKAQAAPVAHRVEAAAPAWEIWQQKTALLPDYDFKSATVATEQGKDSWPSIRLATSWAGLVGSGLTLLLVGILGCLVYWGRWKKTAVDQP